MKIIEYLREVFNTASSVMFDAAVWATVGIIAFGLYQNVR